MYIRTFSYSIKVYCHVIKPPGENSGYLYAPSRARSIHSTNETSRDMLIVFFFPLGFPIFTTCNRFMHERLAASVFVLLSTPFVACLYKGRASHYKTKSVCWYLIECKKMRSLLHGFNTLYTRSLCRFQKKYSAGILTGKRTAPWLPVV